MSGGFCGSCGRTYNDPHDRPPCAVCPQYERENYGLLQVVKPVTLRVCVGCGALVGDTARHNQWHTQTLKPGADLTDEEKAALREYFQRLRAASDER